MKIDDIPQDNSASYHGHRKVIYGTRDGHYEAATSNGWQDEAYATEMAVCELDAQTQAAREAVEKGEYSPLYYHMFRCRYDETGLAKTLQKYADACQISIDNLKQTDI